MDKSAVKSEDEIRAQVVERFGEGMVEIAERMMVSMCEEIATNLRLMGDDCLNSKQTSLLPMLLVSGVKDSKPYTMAFGMGCGFNTDLEKQIGMRKAAVSAIEHGLAPLATGLLSETWTVQLKPGERLGTLLVEDREDRYEALSIMIQSLDKKVCTISSVRVARDADGCFVKQDGEDWVTGKGAHASLLSLFWRAYYLHKCGAPKG